jgi:hypothetical protein
MRCSKKSGPAVAVAALAGVGAAPASRKPTTAPIPVLRNLDFGFVETWDFNRENSRASVVETARGFR